MEAALKKKVVLRREVGRLRSRTQIQSSELALPLVRHPVDKFFTERDISHGSNWTLTGDGI